MRRRANAGIFNLKKARILMDSTRAYSNSDEAWQHGGCHPSSNDKGIALVMVLILALISLAVVSALLFMATQGTVVSGAARFYRTAEEASLGGAEISTGYLSNRGEFNILGVGFSLGCSCGDPQDPNDNIDNMTDARSCRCDKLCNATATWPGSCDDNTGVSGLQIDLNPKINSDFSFALAGSTDHNYTVFTKIVDTVRGNSDMGDVVGSKELGGSAVSAGAAGIISPPHSPYLYRMEVQAEATNNPREVSRVSVLYAY